MLGQYACLKSTGVGRTFSPAYSHTLNAENVYLLVYTVTFSVDVFAYHNMTYLYAVMTIPNVVNEIADVSNWQELGTFLGLGAVDIERIASNYEPREHHQRLVETWFAREPQRSWEKLHRAMEEAAARRGSLTSQPGSIPSTPTSPMGG